MEFLAVFHVGSDVGSDEEEDENAQLWGENGVFLFNQLWKNLMVIFARD